MPFFLPKYPPLSLYTPYCSTFSLQCPRKDDEIYAGELLLGIKYTSDSDNESTNSLLSIESVEGAGHLQVHVVEGAGIVDEDTHKPFNTLCKW